MRCLILAGALAFIACVVVAGSGSAINDTLPPTYMPSGEQMFKQYCAVCHGADARGMGPLAAALKTPPPDLTTLAKHHLDKFPRAYVISILQFGPGANAHGSSDMPTWGPIFRYYDKRNERVVEQRIKNLCDYLASLQEH